MNFSARIFPNPIDPANRWEVAVAGAGLGITIGALYGVFRNFQS